MTQLFMSLVSLIEHFLSHLGALPMRLGLGTKSECRKNLLRDFVFAIRLSKFLLIVLRLVAMRKVLRVCEGTGKTKTRVDIHIVFPGDKPREV